MEIPLFKISICLVCSGFRNLPSLPIDIRNCLIELYKNSLHYVFVNSYCNFRINNDKNHHIFINCVENKGCTLRLLNKIKKPDYSPIKFYQDGYKSLYFSFCKTIEFENFLLSLWNIGILENKLEPIDFDKFILSSNIMHN